MLFRRVLGLLALAAGFLGVAACIAGAYSVWLVRSRLDQINERIFVTLDKGLASAQDRIRGVQKRVQESMITTNEIAKKLRQWSAKTAKERLASQLEIDCRAEELAGRLETVDLWLETSTDSIRIVQQILERGNSVGAPSDPSALEKVLEKLTSLRTTVQQTRATLGGIGKFTSAREGESEENRLSRVTKLVGRTLLTIGEMDTRLEESVTRLSELRSDAQQLKGKTRHYILWTTIGCYLLLAWIGASQAALCLCGRKILARGPAKGSGAS